jgi:hypothetical protein
LRATQGVLALLLMAALLGGPALADEGTAALRSRFDAESDPVRKAKLMPKLGEAEFRDIRKDIDEDRLSDAVAVLKQYRDEAQLCANRLDAAKIDAEKHSSGFKELQISLRESLRRLNEITRGLSADDQALFLEVREDLDEINRHMIQELFPHEPVPGAPSERDSH